MFSIFWLNCFLILFHFLLHYNVDCMWNFFKGRKKEAEQLPLLSQQYYDEGSSSSSIQSNQQTPTKTSNGKRILLVTEAKPPHYSFFVNQNKINRVKSLILVKSCKCSMLQWQLWRGKLKPIVYNKAMKTKFLEI